MSFDDLNLEFEDEEDFKKKKSDAVHVDVDLEFQSQGPTSGPSHSSRPIGQRPAPPAGLPGNVQAMPNRPIPVQRPDPVMTSGSSAMKIAPIPKEQTKSHDTLMEQVRKIEFEAEVKVRVADFKAEILGDILGDMKFMDHQIGQLLARINAKHPDMKQEVLMIKKILADFTAKKRR